MTEGKNKVEEINEEKKCHNGTKCPTNRSIVWVSPFDRVFNWILLLAVVQILLTFYVASLAEDGARQKQDFLQNTTPYLMSTEDKIITQYVATDFTNSADAARKKNLICRYMFANKLNETKAFGQSCRMRLNITTAENDCMCD